MEAEAQAPTKRCPYCGEEILAVAVKCKHCSSTILAPPVKTRLGFKILGVLLLALGLFALVSALIGKKEPTAANEIAAAAKEPALPTSDEADEPTPPSEAFSEFVSNLQSSLTASSLLAQVSVDQLTHDYAFADADQVQKDLKTLKDAVLSGRNEIYSAEYPKVIAAGDTPFFDAVRAAAGKIADTRVDAADRLALGINYNSPDSGGIAKLKRGMPRMEQDFQSAAYAGYKHFGFRKVDVDQDTLALKPASETPLYDEDKPGNDHPLGMPRLVFCTEFLRSIPSGHPLHYEDLIKVTDGEGMPVGEDLRHWDGLNGSYLSVQLTKAAGKASVEGGLLTCPTGVQLTFGRWEASR